jgi:hypothetical protein
MHRVSQPKLHRSDCQHNSPHADLRLQKPLASGEHHRVARGHVNVFERSGFAGQAARAGY